MRVDFSQENGVAAELWDFIDRLAIYNTHEHLPPNKEVYRSLKKDILQEVLCHYIQSDLVSAGMPPGDIHKALQTETDLRERWSLIEPFWKLVEHTGYGSMVRIGCEEILGEALNADSITRVNDRFVELLGGDFYDEILKKKSKIIWSLLDKSISAEPSGALINVIDSDIKVEEEYFKCVYRLDHFIYPRDWQDVLYIESQLDITINSLENWCAACEKALESAIQKGIVAVKTALAYARSLQYELTPRSLAESEFVDILRARRPPLWDKEKFPIAAGQNFQNFMMHFILHLLEEKSVPIQVHTGLQAGNGNRLAGANPLLLNDLFLNYPKVKFVLLHMGYPFYEEAASLVKMFPNVFLDLAWAHIISPEAVVHGLSEWVHMLPQNSIMAFGGDLPSAICLYGHQKIARRNVYKALSEKVKSSDLDLGAAKRIAERWFVTNARELYRL